MLFGISKRANLDQSESFAISALISFCMGAPLFCMIRDVKLKGKTQYAAFGAVD